jgi:hypothetical protein
LYFGGIMLQLADKLNNQLSAIFAKIDRYKCSGLRNKKLTFETNAESKSGKYHHLTHKIVIKPLFETIDGVVKETGFGESEMSSNYYEINFAPVERLIPFEFYVDDILRSTVLRLDTIHVMVRIYPEEITFTESFKLHLPDFIYPLTPFSFIEFEKFGYSFDVKLSK